MENEVEPTSSIPRLRGFVIQAERGGEGGIWVWCCHCGCFHVHGWTPEAYPALRVAHCGNPASPFKKGGYIIEELRLKDLLTEAGAKKSQLRF